MRSQHPTLDLSDFGPILEVNSLEKMTVEKTPCQVLLSFLEYRGFYREPILEAWAQRGALMLSLFRQG
jgi:hypothetical protein